ERRPLLRQERAARRHVRRLDVRAQAEDFEVILGLVLVVLLATGLAHLRMRRHVDPGFRAVATGLPRALPARDMPVRVELGGILAEVPDVAGLVLRVPVARSLLEAAAEVQAVADDDALGTRARLLLVPDRDDVTRRLSVLHASVHVRRPRPQREPRIVYVSAEAWARRAGNGRTEHERRDRGNEDGSHASDGTVPGYGRAPGRQAPMNPNNASATTITTTVQTQPATARNIVPPLGRSPS